MNPRRSKFTKPLDPSIDHVDSSLAHHRAISDKKFLKSLYLDFYGIFLAEASRLPSDGFWVEIGSGGGFIKEVIPKAVTSDVVKVHTLTDMTFSALDMPFKDGEVDVFFLLNTFHHLRDVRVFLNECRRCLSPGGRIIMIEPANTPWSRWIYKNFHHEPFEEDGEWVTEGGRLSGGNQALPWIVFLRDRARFETEFPTLKVLVAELHMPFRYLLSGGLKHRFSVPGFAYGPTKRFEQLLAPLNRHLGMFMTIVVEKRPE